jgi:hypothetical protein
MGSLAGSGTVMSNDPSGPANDPSGPANDAKNGRICTLLFFSVFPCSFLSVTLLSVYQMSCVRVRAHKGQWTCPR